MSSHVMSQQIGVVMYQDIGVITPTFQPHSENTVGYFWHGDRVQSPSAEHLRAAMFDFNLTATERLAS